MEFPLYCNSLPTDSRW